LTNIKIGFTGTSSGMTDSQKGRLYDLIIRNEPAEFHLGDCVGSDAEAFDMIDDLDPYGDWCTVIGHPPEDPKARAFCEYDVTREPKPFIARDHDIVDETDLLIATPKSDIHKICRDGTCATVRYAKSKQKPLVVIFPTGSMKKEFVAKLRQLSRVK